MIIPTKTQMCASTGIRLDDFADDRPRAPVAAAASAGQDPALGIIDGVTVRPLVGNTDDRGSLFELLTTRDGPTDPIVHVYQVAAAPGSIRAWVYHRRQFDRLAFTMGQFEIALYDARPGSRTENRLNVFTLGAKQPALLRIPALVIHGVRNAGTEQAFFVNMPTTAYFPDRPDKSRLPYGDPRVPFTFDAQ
jgi:dTDP-4-dehydrorhamnose 3,5-epimerase